MSLSFILMGVLSCKSRYAQSSTPAESSNDLNAIRQLQESRLRFDNLVRRLEGASPLTLNSFLDKLPDYLFDGLHAVFMRRSEASCGDDVIPGQQVRVILFDRLSRLILAYSTNASPSAMCPETLELMEEAPSGEGSVKLATVTFSPTLRPRVEVDPASCAGCHGQADSGINRPIWDKRQEGDTEFGWTHAFGEQFGPKDTEKMREHDGHLAAFNDLIPQRPRLKRFGDRFTIEPDRLFIAYEYFDRILGETLVVP